jgi:hypothetical protein
MIRTEAEPRRRAVEQGVRRPFEGLAAMDDALRARVAGVLGVALRETRGDARAEAWRILNADLKGLQARSHRPDRMLLPRRNHNWWEILLATAGRLGLDVYPGLSEREVERLVFDRVARRTIDGLEAAEVEVLDLVAREAPAFSDALDRLGLSTEARLVVFAAFHRIAQASPTLAGAADAASRRSAAYLRAGMDRAGVLPCVSRTLRFLKDALPHVLAAWEAVVVARQALPRSARGLALALSALHLHGVVGDCVEELEALRL